MLRKMLITALATLAIALGGCGESAGPLAGGQPAPVSACALTMGWDPWEPYHYMDIGGVVRGVDVELVRAVAQAAGCEVELVRDDFAILLDKLRAGEVDLLTGATATPQRQAYASFSVPYREEKFQLFVRSEDVERYRDATVPQLLRAGFRLGFTAGYYYNQELEALEADPAFAGQLVAAGTGDLNVERLLDHEIDGFVEDQFVAATIIRKRGLEDVIGQPVITVSSKPVRLMMSKSSVSPALARSLDLALAGLRDSDQHAAIVTKYLGGG